MFLGLLAAPHPHAPDLGVEVDIDFVLEHHRLVVRQRPQQVPQVLHLGVVLGVASLQDRTRAAPDQLGAVQPAADGLRADPDALLLPQDEHEDGTAPAAAQVFAKGLAPVPDSQGPRSRQRPQPFDARRALLPGTPTLE